MNSGGVRTVDGPRPRVVFDHLSRMTDERGLFEHALYATPRPEHGYCVDDVARALVVTCREPEAIPAVGRLTRRYLDFVVAAVQLDGSCHNRMAVDGRWQDEPSLGDWWGRALWGLGVAAAQAPTAGMRARALSSFRLAAQSRSPFSKAMVFAGLGAAAVLRDRPEEMSARRLLADAVTAIGVPSEQAGGREWIWPEARLSYANAAVAEVLISAGALILDRTALEHGLAMLRFLLDRETRDGHLSPTPVGGCGPADVLPAFDQQPIEVAALADACITAYEATHDPGWIDGVTLAWAWFCGDNDSATVMFDDVTGGGYDGLEARGRNENQGAESTLAMLSTAQHARHLSVSR